MDLAGFLSRLEKDFFSKLDKKTGWGRTEVKGEFREAIKNTLITTYDKVMNDKKEAKGE